MEWSEVHHACEHFLRTLDLLEITTPEMLPEEYLVELLCKLHNIEDNFDENL